MRTSCKEVLLEYLQNNEGVHKKAFLYSVAEDWLAETVGRALRELEEEGKIFVSYYDGRHAKGLAQYSATKPIKKKMVATEINGKMIISYV